MLSLNTATICEPISAPDTRPNRRCISLPPRRASVMAYTCSLLLRTLPALANEPDSALLQDVLDIPHPRATEGCPS